MAENDVISFDELHDATENDPSESDFKMAAQHLIEAITDWPNRNVQEPKNLIAELKNEIKGELTFDNLNDYFNTLSAERDAWKLEAWSSLCSLFDLNIASRLERSESLEEIIILLTEHYRQKKIK